MDPRVLAFAAAIAIFVLDRFTKWIVETRLSEWETVVVIPGFFNIINTQNPGAAFSLLAGADPQWRNLLLVGVSAAALVLVGVLLWQLPESRILRGGLSLIFGGALGNMYDRLAYGAVTDFLEIYLGAYRWPAFNVADSAISAGAALVIFDMWRARKAPQRT